MHDKSYTVSPRYGNTDSSLVSVLRVLAIVIFVGGAIGGFVLGSSFPIFRMCLPPAIATMSISVGELPLRSGSLPYFPAHFCLHYAKF